ncbi:MAG: hypothetical protein JSU92_10810 [Deltaproteobacteria bacterium]|nr:MAG: hypothetical protein JSU92_10810 [Deltaproteobacteria bacterium]
MKTSRYLIFILLGGLIIPGFGGILLTAIEPEIAVADQSGLGTRSLQAEIVTPPAGKSVDGSSLTVMADLTLGDPSELKSVLFQYKPEESDIWTKIDSNPAHPNPDQSYPYYVHWDVSEFNEGDYHLRAIAKDINGNEDDNPAEILVTIDHSEPEVIEGRIEEGEELDETESPPFILLPYLYTENDSNNEYVSHEGYTKIEKILKEDANWVIAGDDLSDKTTEVFVPQGSLNYEGTVVTIIIGDREPTLFEDESLHIVEFRRVELEGGEDAPSSQFEAEVIISYSDSDQDGIVDGTSLNENFLRLYRFDDSEGIWVESPSSVDARLNKVSGNTAQLSVFGLGVDLGGRFLEEEGNLGMTCNTILNAPPPSNSQIISNIMPLLIPFLALLIRKRILTADRACR